MSRQPVSTEYTKPSCVRENMLSVWIWIREGLDVEIRNRTTAMIAEDNLVSVRDNVEKNRDKIVRDREIIVNELRSKAKSCKGGVTKEQKAFKLKGLLPLMRKLKENKTREGLTTKQLDLLRSQIETFENGRMQKQMTDTLRAGVVAMKKVGISDDASDMDTIVLDMEDALTQQSQVSDSMSMTVVNSMDESDTDEGLMKELMALLGEEHDTDEITHTPIQPQEEKPIINVPQTTETTHVVTSKPTVVLPSIPLSVTEPTTHPTITHGTEVDNDQEENIEDNIDGEMRDVELPS